MYQHIYELINQPPHYVLPWDMNGDFIHEQSVKVIKNRSKSHADFYFQVIRIYFNMYYLQWKRKKDQEKAYTCTSTNEKGAECMSTGAETDQTPNDDNLNSRPSNQMVESISESEPTKNNNQHEEHEEEKQGHEELEDKKNYHEAQLESKRNENDEIKTVDIYDAKTEERNDAEQDSSTWYTQYKSSKKFQKFKKKLYRFILLRTHPDKTKKAHSKVFIESKRLYDADHTSVLFIVAMSLGYRCQCLTDQEVRLLDINISELITLRTQF